MCQKSENSSKIDQNSENEFKNSQTFKKIVKIFQNRSKILFSLENPLKIFKNLQKVAKTLKTPVLSRQVAWERWMAPARAKKILSAWDGSKMVTPLLLSLGVHFKSSHGAL